MHAATYGGGPGGSNPRWGVGWCGATVLGLVVAVEQERLVRVGGGGSGGGSEIGVASVFLADEGYPRLQITLWREKAAWALELQPGDLLFYYNPSWGRVGHVSMYIGGGMVVEASSPATGVRIHPVYWSNFVKAGRPYS